MRYYVAVEKIADIDVLGDEATQLRVTRWSQTTLAVGVLVAAVTALLTGMDGGALMTAPWWIAVVVASIVALPVHELVHGAAFALLCPGCKVSFGAKDAFLYTRTDGALTTRGRMVAVLAAPAVVVTVALAAAAAAAGMPTLAVLLAVLHLSGCAGDLLMAREILRTPGCTHVRDTESGVELLRGTSAPRD